MLREIISITGKPGLYKILTQGKRTIIVEELDNSKRFPVMARDKVVSLGDIAMYTRGEDLPLGKILDKAYAHYEGKTVDVKELAAKGALREEFAKIVPDYDADRVYDTDIKKFFTWYNLLVNAGMSKFTKDVKLAKGAPEKEGDTTEETTEEKAAE